MSKLKIGDIVSRKSYGGDIFFKVVDVCRNVGENLYILKAISYRLEADAPESDLMVMSEDKVEEHKSDMDSITRRKSKENREIQDNIMANNRKR